MVAATMSTALVQTRVTVRSAAPVQQRRAALLVRADAEATSRRAALGMLAGVLGGLTLAAGEASARTGIPFQESLNRSGSSTEASMSGYTMEGTKKRGISPAQRKAFLAQSKQAALAGLAGNQGPKK